MKSALRTGIDAVEWETSVPCAVIRKIGRALPVQDQRFIVVYLSRYRLHPLGHLVDNSDINRSHACRFKSLVAAREAVGRLSKRKIAIPPFRFTGE